MTQQGFKIEYVGPGDNWDTLVLVEGEWQTLLGVTHRQAWTFVKTMLGKDWARV